METFAPKGKIFGPILPQFVLDMPLSLGAKVVYALLCNYASEKDHCWPSQTTLAERLKCGVSSIKNYLAELVRENLITVRREHYRSSVYYLVQPEALRTRLKSAIRQPKSDGGQPKFGYINTLNKQRERNTPLPPMRTERKVSQTPCAPSAGGVDSLNLDFEKAWESYPRKEAKGFARMAWFKLLRSGQLPSLQDLLSVIARSRSSESWQREEGRFIPQMGNWLRGRRWLDEAESTAKEEDARVREEAARQTARLEEAEMRRKAAHEREAETLRPAFEKFLACFPEGTENHGPAWGLWNLLYRKGQAPSAADVSDASLSPFAFLNQWRMAHAQG